MSKFLRSLYCPLAFKDHRFTEIRSLSIHDKHAYLNFVCNCAIEFDHHNKRKDTTYYTFNWNRFAETNRTPEESYRHE